MDASDPEESVHTRWILRIAGIDGACGNCGNRFATDVRLVEDAELPANAVVTRHLCERCIQLKAAEGKTFVPF